MTSAYDDTTTTSLPKDRPTDIQISQEPMFNLQGSDTDDQEKRFPDFFSKGDKYCQMEGDCQFMPFIRTMQRIVLYMTKSRIYIVGSNNMETKFRVLKIDRTEPRALKISDDKIVYSQKEIRELLIMIDTGNRSKSSNQRIGSGLHKTHSAYGIIGFVRFLQGYYILLIKSRKRVAMVGQHCIYKILDTDMVYIPNDEAARGVGGSPSNEEISTDIGSGVNGEKLGTGSFTNGDHGGFHPEESRYYKMFNAIDLTSNFYYSYSYDLTNTLQYNMQDPIYIQYPVPFPGKNSEENVKRSKINKGCLPSTVAYSSAPNERYLWNKYLLDPVGGFDGEGVGEQNISQDWILPVIHGFVDQCNISIYGSPVLLTLIARRSNRYAGTRFLKRGANYDGDCANEVETEQIVADTDVSSLTSSVTKQGDRKGSEHISSFVQLRASVPAHWSQTMTAQPPIYFELNDPYSRTSGRHFNYLMKKYGSPIVVLNLMKKTEEKGRRDRRREGILSDEFRRQVEYLNQFLPEEHAIEYISFDMAKCKKRIGERVMRKLADIASFAVKKTGIFHNSQTRPVDGNTTSKANDDDLVDNVQGLKQTGVVRTNCVDCLDRTNTAQYVVAKAALGLQLYHLGYLPTPNIDYDCDCCRMLESMYEDHGDTLALQYGGSQLIHRIKSYRKQAKWTSKASDISQTARRYYSNTLCDQEKQNTMNVFLGAFRPSRHSIQIWDKEFTTDHYLHFKQLNKARFVHSLFRDYGPQWFDQRLKSSLPYPLDEKDKACLKVIPWSARSDNCDLYQDCYRTFELTVLTELFLFDEVSHSVKDYMPHCCTDFSPFLVRDREVKRREDSNSAQWGTTGKNLKKNVKAIQMSLPALMFPWSMKSSGGSSSPDIVEAGPSFKQLSSPRNSVVTGSPSTSSPLSERTSNDKSGPIGPKPPTPSDLVGKNPSVAGTSSTASNTASGSDGESDQDEASSSSDEFDFLDDRKEADICEPDGLSHAIDSGIFDKESKASSENSSALSFNMMFKSTEDQYGFGLQQPEQSDYELYKRYVSIGEQANKPSQTNSPIENQSLTTSNMFSLLNDVLTESKKKSVAPRIGASATKTVEVGINNSHSGDSSKGTRVDKLSKKSFAFSPEVYEYYDTRNDYCGWTKNAGKTEYNTTIQNGLSNEDTKLYQDYIEIGKSAKSSVEKSDMDLYKQWVDIYNNAVTTPNKLN